MDIRQILHWLVDEITVPSYSRGADRPTADEVRDAIDEAHGYEPPKPALTAEEQAQLDALVAKQAAQAAG